MNIRKINYQDYIKNKDNLHEQITQLLFSKKCTSENKNKANKVISNMEVYIKDETAIIYGIFENEIIKGFIWSYLLKDTEKTAHINYFNIVKDCRRMGYGTHLLNELEQELTKKNVRKVNLYVKKSNQSGINFYKKNKFKSIYDDNEKILLEKEI